MRRAINSPQLLMLSGVGPREHLAEHGIEVVHDAPGVGSNLLDHLVVLLGFEANCDTLISAEKPLQLLNYLTRRRGMLTSNVGEAYGFVRSDPDLAQPDVELIFAPRRSTTRASATRIRATRSRWGRSW